MVMLPLILVLSALALLILSAILFAYMRFRTLEKRLASMDRDLHQFYRDLGRPKAEIINIQAGKRPS
jgi:hypothetical protein